MSPTSQSPFANCHTLHAQFADPQRIRRTELSSACRRLIARKSAYLDRTCRKIWTARNPLGEDFIFAAFCRNRDRVIVTLAAYIPRVGWVTQH